MKQTAAIALKVLFLLTPLPVELAQEWDHIYWNALLTDTPKSLFKHTGNISRLLEILELMYSVNWHQLILISFVMYYISVCFQIKNRILQIVIL